MPKVLNQLYDFSAAAAALRMGAQEFQQVKAWIFTEFELLKHNVRNQIETYHRTHEAEIATLKSNLAECQQRCELYERTLKAYLEAKYGKKSADVKTENALTVHLFTLENYEINTVYRVDFGGNTHEFYPFRMAQVEGRNNIPIGDAFAYIVKASVKLMLPDNTVRTRYSMSQHPRKGHLSFPIEIFYDLIYIMLAPLKLDQATTDYLKVCLIDKVADNLRDFFNNERVRIRSMETKKMEKSLEDGVHIYCRCPTKDATPPALLSPPNQHIAALPYPSFSNNDTGEPVAKKPFKPDLYSDDDQPTSSSSMPFVKF
uniref:PI3K/PI4K domain-containing protein n=1 Tax=Panagrellus redivivus TaxID=6233 RepID=A0A7E4V7D6_PANRE